MREQYFLLRECALSEIHHGNGSQPLTENRAKLEEDKRERKMGKMRAKNSKMRGNMSSAIRSPILKVGSYIWIEIISSSSSGLISGLFACREGKILIKKFFPLLQQH